MSSATEIIKEAPVPAGEVFDEKGRLIGRYVYLRKGDDEDLNGFCQSWLDTYEHDDRFFITLDLETTGLKPHEGKILLVSISWDGKQSIIFCPHDFENLELFKEVLRTVPINNQNIKFDLKWLLYHFGTECNVFMDTMVGSQLGWAGSFPKMMVGTFGLSNIAKQLLNGYVLEKDTRNEFIGMKLEDGFSKKQIEYAVKDSLITHKLVWPITKRLHNQGLWDIWEEIERPLIEILVRSEVKGVTVNVEEVERLLTEKERELSLIYDNIREEVEKIPASKLPIFPKGSFNPGSSQQIVNVLGAIGIKVLNTEKSTLQTTQATAQHPLLENIIKWRTTKSIISKFLTKWLEEHIDPATNCIYTSFNTYGAETGRLSCKEPNMQQIPGDLRSMIVARKGWKILSMDYSQFEFRAAAAITEEEYLMEAFIERQRLLPDVRILATQNGFIDPDAFVKAASKDKTKFRLTQSEENLIHNFAMTDIHRRNAALILGKDVSDVTSTERSVGKCVALDTYVHTNKGIMRLRDLLPKKVKKDTYYDLKGVKILTDEGYKDAPTVYYNGKSKVLKITTKTGRSIVCTPTHRFRTIDKAGAYVWRTANKLKVGSDVFLKLGGSFTKGEKSVFDMNITSDLMYLLGLLARVSLIDEIVTVPEEFEEEVITLIRKIPELEKVKILKANKREDARIYSTELKLAVAQVKKELPSEMLRMSQEHTVAFLKGLASKGTLGFQFAYESTMLLKQLQNLLLNLKVNTYISIKTVLGIPTLHCQGEFQDRLVAHLKGEKIDKKAPYMNGINAYKLYASRNVHAKVYDSEITDSCENIESCMTEKEWDTTKFLMNNELLRDEIVAITEVNDCEVGDVTVPDNSTVVYEGFVTHNTLGYAVLYGAGAPRVQESLAKEGFYHDMAECARFLEDFFLELPKIKLFIDETHAKVIDPGYITTIMGRKRFFELPPRYLTRRYEQELQAAYREATNFCFQGANADATKKAMVQMDKVFQKFPEDVRPILLLTVHDEIVIEAHETNCEEVAKIGEKIMVEAGMESVNWKVPIEVSRTMGDTWNK